MSGERISRRGTGRHPLTAPHECLPRGPSAESRRPLWKEPHGKVVTYGPSALRESPVPLTPFPRLSVGADVGRQTGPRRPWKGLVHLYRQTLVVHVVDVQREVHGPRVGLVDPRLRLFPVRPPRTARSPPPPGRAERERQRTSEDSRILNETCRREAKEPCAPSTRPRPLTTDETLPVQSSRSTVRPSPLSPVWGGVSVPHHGGGG